MKREDNIYRYDIATLILAYLRGEINFTGITDVLELLSLTTNIKFEVKDRTVMVMEKE